MCLVKLFFFVLVFFSYDVSCQYYTPFNTTIIPITKDANTSLPKVSWGFKKRAWDGEPYFLIDLDAPFTWKDCVVRHSEIPCWLEEGCRFPLRCDHTLCKEAKSYINPSSNCPSLNVTTKYGCNICAVTPFNPISESCKISQLTTDLVDFYVTDGRNPITDVFPPFGVEFVVSCAPSSLLRSFPKDVNGVAAFSWSSLAFPRQVSFPKVADKFALCLPSASSASGVTFLGDGPFYFTNFPKLDLRSILSYTPMIRKPPKSLGYYITINKILIKGVPIRLPLLKRGYVKLSTVVPYTILRSDIYKALVTSFSKATTNIPRVDAVKPFSLCLKASAIRSIRTGYRVPNIDLRTEGGKIWTVSEGNSIKYIGKDAACLAFVNGGLGVKDAIVIGTFQMENNFLFLDLENRKLGFSSSLVARGTSCSSFNLTEIPNRVT